MTTRRVAALALTMFLTLTTLAPAPTASAATVRLDGVTVRLPAGTTQVITVNRTRGWHARVTFWRRSSSGWQKLKQVTDGRTGYGGLVVGSRRKQGTGTTPLGTYRLISSFGTHARSKSWDVSYRKIRRGDFWVQDNQSRYYNRYRNKSQGGFRWWLKSGPNTSERLTDYRRQYEYAVNTTFNIGQVRHRGAGIFLHVNGRGATAGCISVPRSFMRSMMAGLNPKRRPVIAIGR